MANGTSNGNGRKLDRPQGTLYHVFQWDKRRRTLLMVTGKERSRWDDAQVPAVWAKRSAAQEWGKSRFGTAGFKVLRCENDLCGMGEHGRQEWWQNGC